MDVSTKPEQPDPNDPAGDDSPAAHADLDDSDPALAARPRRIRRRAPRKRLSQILTTIAADDSRERISVRDLMAMMPGRALTGLILLFAAPNVVPGPPGLSTVLGLPLVYLTFQLMMGKKPWLPNLIAERSLMREDLAVMVDRIAPLLARVERLLRPRFYLLANRRAEHVVGAFCLLLSIILTLPVPLGNMLPALAISLMALGLLQRDGLWVAIGAATGVVSLFIVAGVVYALLKAAAFIIMSAFS